MLELRQRILKDRRRQEAKEEQARRLEEQNRPIVLKMASSREGEDSEPADGSVLDDDELRVQRLMQAVDFVTASDGSAGQASPEDNSVPAGHNSDVSMGGSAGEQVQDYDDDGTAAAARAKRLAAIKKHYSKLQEFKAKGHGEYREIDEQEFLGQLTSSPIVVCHFFHPDFETCKVMDAHIKKLVEKYLFVKFIRLNADKAKFFVPKLNIKVLPTLVIFQDGVAVDRIIGFHEVSEGSEFPTWKLEKRLGKSGLIDVDVAAEKEDEEEAAAVSNEYGDDDEW